MLLGSRDRDPGGMYSGEVKKEIQEVCRLNLGLGGVEIDAGDV